MLSFLIKAPTLCKLPLKILLLINKYRVNILPQFPMRAIRHELLLTDKVLLPADIIHRQTYSHSPFCLSPQSPPVIQKAQLAVASSLIRLSQNSMRKFSQN